MWFGVDGLGAPGDAQILKTSNLQTLQPPFLHNPACSGRLEEVTLLYEVRSQDGEIQQGARKAQLTAGPVIRLSWPLVSSEGFPPSLPVDALYLPPRLFYTFPVFSHGLNIEFSAMQSVL